MKGDIFTRLSQQVINTEHAARPAIPSRFVYGPTPAFASHIHSDEHPDGENSFSEENRAVRHASSTAGTVKPLIGKNSKIESTAYFGTQDTTNLENTGFVEITTKKVDPPTRTGSRSLNEQPDDYETGKLLRKRINQALVPAGQDFDKTIFGKDQTPNNEIQLLVPIRKLTDIGAWETYSEQHDNAPKAIEQKIPNKNEIDSNRLTSGPAQDVHPNPFQYSRNKLKKQSGPPTPTIRVTIGRIEVRAVTAPQTPRRPAPIKAAPSLSLDDYLKQRSEGRR